MKRLLRVTLKLITLPITLIMMFLITMVGSFFVFVEWLNEDADPFCSHKDHMKRYIREYCLYFKGLLT